ncbi:hypothetical protein IWT140_00567 [Secundilactobacillus pentosiphilus]|uniref:Uncharacterized protein n=1 Tax=Secundilactobacillus pentosiphilus TaxID=1714682 RepID=A0A1Z5IMJ5_9LACO|nr:hypothetical protein [Secundilactobacillus pentosiphilus]GAX02969.1 hypothetical protein IWT140_00567 [Secundilactobacillus pentosiphilus]
MFSNEDWRELRINANTLNSRTIIAQVKTYGSGYLDLIIPAVFQGPRDVRQQAKEDNGYDAFVLPEGTRYGQISFRNKYGNWESIVSQSDFHFNELVLPPATVRLPIS